MALEHRDCPLFLHHVSYAMVPQTHHVVPDDVPEVFMICPDSYCPLYLGIHSNADLIVTKNIENPDLITIAARIPYNTSLSPPLPTVKHTVHK
ncbi:hypothetical protein EV363DRAFT_1181948 [Boletus edulis]|nr:hypothetical protein EV363DRAFT_1181948 [Boletus edulis]